MNWTPEEYEALQKRRQTRQAPTGATTVQKAGKRAKYGNTPVLVDLGPSGELVGGKLRLVHTFDSQQEADYFADLKLRRAAGEISDLELQKSYALIAHAQVGPSVIIGYYEADFVFFDLTANPNPRALPGRERVIDVKGMKTQVYALKKKIVEACWSIVIEEV